MNDDAFSKCVIVWILVCSALGITHGTMTDVGYGIFVFAMVVGPFLFVEKS